MTCRWPPGRLFVILLVSFLLVISFISVYHVPSMAAPAVLHHDRDYVHKAKHAPHQNKFDSSSTEFPIVIVADMDHASKVKLDKLSPKGKKQLWQSHLKTGVITVTANHSYSVRWTGTLPLYSSLNVGGRGMELSELLYFQGRLLAFSDRTGVIHQILNNKIVPLWILADGDGTLTDGFKSEWATVKDDLLYVGSTGKPWQDATGAVVNNWRQWVKVIDSHGKIDHVDWAHVYQRIQNVTGAQDGYVLHEAVVYHPERERWFFLPRKVSKTPYKPSVHQKIGGNLLISCDAQFENWKVQEMGKYHEAHGYSSFKFLPGRKSHIVALKTEEIKDKVHTDIVVMDIDTGQVLMDEVTIGDIKYEGIEINNV